MTTTKVIRKPPQFAPGEGVSQALHAGLYISDPVSITVSTTGTDTSPADLFMVSPNTLIYDVLVNTTTALVPTTGASLLIGLDSDCDAFHNDTTTVVLGSHSMHGKTAVYAGGHLTTGYHTVTAQWSTTSTAGAFTVRLVYRPYGDESFSDIA